ncbi:SCO family protein [Pararhodospirillum oryzae]|uniref:Electron transporter SenC n=1 Tax=Pararhodospirillum oryzae TaxID=478448 RepID=A0A512H8A0_9PROT|nr:SCO family protein [Pararhodospirillum oryzae]GEO81689.1 electron transporter SenC [Pararhodospirillum oryzae]
MTEPSSETPRSPSLMGRLVGPLIIIVVVIGIAFLGRIPLLPGPQSGLGGPFTLVNEAGETVTDQTFAGRFLLVYFGYTSCPDVCPTSLALIGRALDMAPPEARARVTPLFISVDPERDTPERAASYARAFHPALIGLTGTPEQIAAVAHGYRATYARVDHGENRPYTIDHSAYIYLMGPDGRFLAHFEPNTPPERIADALRAVMGLPKS